MFATQSRESLRLSLCSSPYCRAGGQVQKDHRVHIPLKEAILRNNYLVHPDNATFGAKKEMRSHGGTGVQRAK